MDYGTLRVTTPDGQIREYPIDVSSVLIGRAEGNRVVIDHVSVSRRHARLVIDGARATLEDLNSANGTFVGSSRIAPGVPTAIGGQELRFGDCEGTFTPAAAPSAVAAPALESLAVAGPAAPARAPSVPVSPPAPAPPDEQQTIAVSVVSPAAPVAAGAQTTATVTVHNRGAATDELSISIPDLPPAWVRVSRPHVQLVPGARDEVTVVIAPPRTKEALAGDYTFSAAVVSRVQGVEVRALGRLTVLPFAGFRIELKPPRGRRAFRLVTVNDSNTTVAGTFGATGDADQLRFDFRPESFELPPGGEQAVALHVRPRRRRLFGAEETHRFRVEARPAIAGQQAVATEGQLVVRPLWLTLRLVLATLVLFTGVGGGIFGYRSACRSSWPLCAASAIPRVTGTPVTAAPTATPDATQAPSPEATEAPATPPPTAPAGLQEGGQAVVINSAPNPPSNSNCLALRRDPAINAANILRRLCDGTSVTLVDGPRNEGAYTWWLIDDGQGQGWAAEGPVAGGARWLEAR
jgi:hypothetical protein